MLTTILISLLAIFFIWAICILFKNERYILVIMVVASPYIAYKTMIYSHYKSYLPPDMGVWKQLYSKNESWGFGPGGNETGLIEFELPSRVSESITKEGTDYLKRLKSGKGCSDEWQETPNIGQNWYKTDNTNNSTIPEIQNYLYRYGFYIPIDKEIINEVNQTISKPGSYLSYCQGGGVIIVMPKIQKIIFAYSG